MTKEEAIEKLGRYGQEHALRFYDELDEDKQRLLLDQIEDTDLEVLTHYKEKNAARGEFSPIKTMQLDEIEARRDELKAAGVKTIREGKVAALLLAGVWELGLARMLRRVHTISD